MLAAGPRALRHGPPRSRMAWPILAAFPAAPPGGQFRTQDYDRERMGLAWLRSGKARTARRCSPCNICASESTNSWGEHTFEAAPDLSEYNTYPAGCQQNGNGRTGARGPSAGSTVRGSSSSPATTAGQRLHRQPLRRRLWSQLCL